MEVPRVRKAAVNELDLKQESVVIISTKKRKCILDPTLTCIAPNCHYAICAKCPYGYLYSFSGLVRNIYRKIIGLAMFWMNRQ